MKTKTIIFFILIFFLLVGLQCPKDKNDPGNPNAELQLPPISTEGKHTIGCKIDGKVWIPYSKTFAPKLHAAIDRNFNWKLILWGSQIDAPGLDKNNLEIYCSPLSTDTFFLLTKNRNGNIMYFTPDLNGKTVFKTNEAFNNGSVSILRFDSINQIISGTFYGIVIDSITNEKHEITDGRFDLRFAY